MQINNSISIQDLQTKLATFWKISGAKIKAIEQEYDTSKGSPVFTVKGKLDKQEIIHDRVDAELPF